MRKFLLRISGFILPIVIVMYPTDYIVSKYLSEPKDYGNGELNVWNDIYAGNVNADLVIYGSSRAWVHISPKIIEDSLQISSYNLGIDGHNFWLQYLRHKELLKFNKKPSQILISLDMFTFEKRIDLFNYQQFLPYLLWNNDFHQYTKSYIGFSSLDYNIPLIRYQHEGGFFIATLLKNSLHHNATPSRIKGYMGEEKKWNNDLAKAKSKANYYEVKLDTLTVRLFEQFLNECNEDDIKITFVYSPEYIEGQSYIKNRKNIISLYEYFAQKYNLQFLDYSNDSLCMQKQFFYNSLHLNKQGAEIFTNKLVKDLKALDSQKEIMK